MRKNRSNRGRHSKSRSKHIEKYDATIKKWNTIEDIPMDEEDLFHAAKDKILLQGNYEEYSGDGDEDEVFRLKGMDDDSEDEEHDNFSQDEQYQEEQSLAKKPKGKKAKKKKSKSSEKKFGEDEEEESWGKGKAAYYSSNADQLASDDEEGNELEEKEAIRLQAKIRQELEDEDFGLKDSLEPPERQAGQELDDILDPQSSVLPALPTDKHSLLRHLEKANPESLALARDWDDVAHQLVKTKTKIEKMEAEKSDSLSIGMIHLHYQALLSYTTVLAFYLHLRSSAKYSKRPALLQSHPIMQRLLTLKQSLQTLEDLDFAGSDDSDDWEDEDGEYMGISLDEILMDGERVWKIGKEGRLEPHELEDLLNDAEMSVDASGAVPEIKEREEKPPKKKRKVASDDRKDIALPVFDLIEPEFVPSAKPSKSKSTTSLSSSSAFSDPSRASADAYGELTVLKPFDAADKSARKRSLRFHTSKIDSASSRRKGARYQTIGGDDDIPYRERKRVKEVRLVKEAAKRGMEGGEDLDMDMGEDAEIREVRGKKRVRENDDGEESPGEYYELVQRLSKEEKARKKAGYEEVHGSRISLDESSQGPRSLTRAILKNKGLTPQRPKEVRNPRVKKRQKFAKAQKKVASQKTVYKGGLKESKGVYEGERSGISKVIKSVKLG